MAGSKSGKQPGRRVSDLEETRRREQSQRDRDTVEAPVDPEQDYQVLSSDEQVTSAAEWAGARGVVLLLPSGNRCRVRTSGFQALIAAGQIPNSLLPLVQEALAAGQRRQAIDESALLTKMLADPQSLNALMKMYDDVVLFSVLEPRVLPVPLDGNGQPVPIHDRPTDVEGVWVDMVDLSEKTAIFNFAARGTGQLEPFRQE